MRLRIDSLVLLVALTLAFTGIARAIPVGPLDLAWMTHEADLIAVGRVLSIQEKERISINTQGESVPARVMTATLRVERISKGHWDKPTLTFDFLMPEAHLGFQGVPATQFGLFFLRRKSPQQLVILDPYHPFVVASPEAPIAKEDALDRVVAEVAHVLLVPKSTLEERKEAITALFNVKTEGATEVLRQVVRQGDVNLQVQAAAALFNRNDISALDMAERILMSPPGEVDRKDLVMLAQAIRFGVKDPQAIPALTRLLNARSVETRRAVAAALRSAGTDAAIDGLVAALEDDDQDVRYYAVMGLSEITGYSQWGPSTDLFQQEEQRYLSYWREWAQRR